MLRFIDLRGQDADGRFAWYCTVRSTFLSYFSETWDTFDEFAEDYKQDAGGGYRSQSYGLDRFRRLTPEWAFGPAEAPNA